MAAIWSQVSSVTDPDHTKPKPILDDGDKDEAAETKDTSKSAKRGGAPRLCPQEDEELAELCDFALSFCETQHVSFVTESGHTKPKPKLDDRDKDEAVEMKDTSKSPKQAEMGTGFDDDSSDDNCVSSVTDFNHTKLPKLDEVDETKDSSKFAKRWETSTKFDDDSSDDFGYNDEPAETNDTSKSAIQGETGTIFDGDSSDEDMKKRERRAFE